MKALTRFITGMACGAIIGAAASLLFTPTSGQDLADQARARWEGAIAEAKAEMERTQAELSAEFESKKQGA